MYPINLRYLSSVSRTSSGQQSPSFGFSIGEEEAELGPKGSSENAHATKTICCYPRWNESYSLQLGCDEGVEQSVVANANTVVDPGTVVVEAVNTPVANVAVATSIGSDYFALRTEAIGFELFEQSHELQIMVLLNVPGIFAPREHAQNH